MKRWYQSLNDQIEEAEKALGNLEGAERAHDVATERTERNKKLVEYQHISFVMSYGKLMDDMLKGMEGHRSDGIRLDPCTNDNMKFSGGNGEELTKVVNHISIFGELVDGYGKAEYSTANGDGLKDCFYQELKGKSDGKEELPNCFKIISHSDKNVRNKLGGDKILLTVDRTRWQSSPDSAVENPIRYKVNHLGEGEYDVRYSLVERGKGIILPLRVELNGDLLQNKIFDVNIVENLAAQVTFMNINSMSISSDGYAATGTANDSWCRITNPLPKDRSINLLLTVGSTPNYFTLSFYTTTATRSRPGHYPKDGPGNYSWSLTLNQFYHESKVLGSGDTKAILTAGSVHKVTIQIKNNGIHCFYTDKLQFIINDAFDYSKDYYLYSDGYYPSSKIESVSA